MQDEGNRKRVRGHKDKWAAKNPDYNKEYYQNNKEKWPTSEYSMQWFAEAKEEAERLRPVLDEIAFTPDNLPRIATMVDYIEFNPSLAFILDWYWLSDAKEYLDEHY